MQKGNEKNEGIKNGTVIVEVVEIPRFGFLRIKQVLLVIPISKASWWAGVKTGIYPASIKLSARTTVWSAEDVFNLVEQLRAAQAA